jgi:hypothetical protein
LLSRYLVNATARSFDIFILQTWNTDVPQARVRPPQVRPTGPEAGPSVPKRTYVGVSLIRNRRTPRPTIGPRRVLCRGAFL